MTYTTHPGLLRIDNANDQTADGTVSPLSPAQCLLAIDPSTSAKSQPAAAFVLPASTDQDWDKSVTDLLAAQQGGPSLKDFKAVLAGFNGTLTPDIRRALMVLIEHWYSYTGTMNVTQADMHKILPVEDDLQGRASW